MLLVLTAFSTLEVTNRDLNTTALALASFFEGMKRFYGVLICD
jgi:hypothetical protein